MASTFGDTGRHTPNNALDGTAGDYGSLSSSWTDSSFSFGRHSDGIYNDSGGTASFPELTLSPTAATLSSTSVFEFAFWGMPLSFMISINGSFGGEFAAMVDNAGHLNCNWDATGSGGSSGSFDYGAFAPGFGTRTVYRIEITPSAIAFYLNGTLIQTAATGWANGKTVDFVDIYFTAVNAGVKAVDYLNNALGTTSGALGAPSGGGGAPTDAPGALAISAITDTGFTASWGSVSGATSYEVATSAVGSGMIVYVDIGNTLTIGVSPLTPRASYDFYVRGKNGSGPGPASTARLTLNSAPLPPYTNVTPRLQIYAGADPDIAGAVQTGGVLEVTSPSEIETLAGVTGTRLFRLIFSVGSQQASAASAPTVVDIILATLLLGGEGRFFVVPATTDDPMFDAWYAWVVQTGWPASIPRGTSLFGATITAVETIINADGSLGMYAFCGTGDIHNAVLSEPVLRDIAPLGSIDSFTVGTALPTPFVLTDPTNPPTVAPPPGPGNDPPSAPEFHSFWTAFRGTYEVP